MNKVTFICFEREGKVSEITCILAEILQNFFSSPPVLKTSGCNTKEFYTNNLGQTLTEEDTI